MLDGPSKVSGGRTAYTGRVPTPAEHASRIVRAFPSALEADVRAVCQDIPASDYGPTESVLVVHINGETIRIPHRVYFDEPSYLLGPRGVRKDILACVYSRHHDGFVRERYVKHLLSSDHAWVPPFAVQLAGEYVLQIVQLVASHSARLGLEPYRSFVAQNPAFMAVTRQRMVSYWDCYYRRDYPDFAAYPGSRVLEALQAP